MGLEFFTYDGGRRYVNLDPRTKLFLLITVSSLMLGGGSEGMMKGIRLLLSLVPFALLLSERRFKTAGKYMIFYLICFGLEYTSVTYLRGTVSFLGLAVSSIMTKFAPGLMMAAFFLSITSVSEFVAVMQRMHVSEKIIIPLSVIFRFFPTIGEEYHAISDAMRMRQIRFGGKKPFEILEYRIVPLMISVIKIGDELSAAALTRGMGCPGKRTNICEIGFHFQDIAGILLCIFCLGVFLVQQFLI